MSLRSFGNCLGTIVFGSIYGAAVLGIGTSFYIFNKDLNMRRNPRRIILNEEFRNELIPDIDPECDEVRKGGVTVWLPRK